MRLDINNLEQYSSEKGRLSKKDKNKNKRTKMRKHNQ
jgi:hypothetical protein